MSRLCGALLALLVAAPALAEDAEGTGRISLLPGWRYVPNDFFFARAASLGHPKEHAMLGGPELTGVFAYAATPELEVGIDLFAGADSMRLRDLGAISLVTYGALVDLRVLLSTGPWVPTLGLSTGPTLVYATQAGGTPAETFLNAYAASVGLLWRATDRIGANLEARYLAARGSVPGVGGVNGGGFWAGVGVTWFFAPEADRPGAVR